MPSGKKRTKASGDDNEESEVPLVKRVKSESQDNSSVVWEWEDDGHVWKPFSDDLKSEVEAAFKSKMMKTKVAINDTKFDIIFERMVQRNAKTFWERRIRVNRPGEDGGLEGTYEYDESKGKWKKYNQNIQRLIYAANVYELDKVTYTHQKVNITIDLTNMVEVNEKKKTKRKVRKDADGSEDDEQNNNSKQEEEEEKGKQKSKITKTKIKKEKVCVEDSTKSKQKAKASGKENKKKKSETEEKEVVRSIAFKGKAPVDPECFSKDKYYVYFEGDDIYDAMLNQTNLKNNNNKFYLMQVLRTNTGSSYAVWFRWGRVGMTGQTNLINCGTDLEKAKDIFFNKFFDKTKNEFSDRKRFKKVAGKYDLLIMDYKATDKDEVDGPEDEKKKEKKIPESKLDKKLQALIELLFSVKEMEDAVIEMKYDTKKAPLGKLTKEQIKAGYKALKKIEQCISKNMTGNELILACDAFYTRVPHCFGMQRPPVIRTKAEVQRKVDLLETLGDIEIAMKVIQEEGDKLLNPIDQHYVALKCDMFPLDRDSEAFGIIEKYTQNTHAKTHNQYKMEILDVFEIAKCQQNQNFHDVGNKMLLWHGSRLTNWVGILSQGLRIAPPEAPVTGYMFGKGVYFADMSSKSANYCYPTRTKNVGFALLCEVSLGKTNDLLAADYDGDKLPADCNSTKGLGKTAPDEKDNITMPDGVVVPLGKHVDTGVENPNGYTLNYNEYVVYNSRQIKAKYLVQIKFNFK